MMMLLRALDVEGAVFDRGAVGRKDGQAARAALDIHLAYAGRDQARMEERRGVRRERRAAQRLYGGTDFVPAQVEVVHDLDDLDRPVPLLKETTAVASSSGEVTCA